MHGLRYISELVQEGSDEILVVELMSQDSVRGIRYAWPEIHFRACSIGLRRDPGSCPVYTCFAADDNLCLARGGCPILFNRA